MARYINPLNRLYSRNKILITGDTIYFVIGFILMVMLQLDWVLRHKSQLWALRFIILPFLTGLLFCPLVLLKPSFIKIVSYIESSLSLPSLFSTEKRYKHEYLFAGIVLSIILVFSFFNIVFSGYTLLTSPISPGTMPTGPYNYYGPSAIMPVFDPGASALQNEPMAAKIRNEIRSGRLPFWNSNTGVGVPLLANIISAPFSPFRIMLLVSNSPAMWDFYYLLRLLAAGFFTYMYLRLILISPLGAIVGAISFMLCGYFIEYINMCHLDVEVLYPLLLLAFEHLFREWRPRTLLFASISVCISVLGGMPESTFFLLFFTSCYYFWRVLSVDLKPKSKSASYVLKHCFRFSLAAISGILLSGPQLFPFLEFLNNSSHVHNTTIGLTSAPALGSITLLIPYFFGKVQDNFNGINSQAFLPYIGALPMMLALVGTFSKRIIAYKLRYLFVLFAVFCLLKSYGFVFINWVGHLPIFQQLIFPKYCTPLVSFCIAALAAIGFESLIQRQVYLRTIIWLYAFIFALVSIYFCTRDQALIALMMIDVNVRHIAIQIGFALMLYAMLYYFIFLVLKKNKASSAIFIFLLFISELYHFIPQIRPLRYDPATQAPFVQFLKNDSDKYRVLGVNSVLIPNSSVFHDLDCVTDVSPMYPFRYTSFVKTLIYPEMIDRFSDFDKPIDFKSIQRYLSLMNVKYILAAADLQSSYFISNILTSSSLAPASDHGIKKSNFIIDGHSKVVLLQAPNSLIRHRVFIQPDSILSFSIGLSPESWMQLGDGVGFGIKIDDGKSVHEIFYKRIDPKNNKSDRRWFDYSLDLRAFSNQIITLILETHEIDSNISNSAGWGDLKLEPRTQADELRLVYDKEVKIYQNTKYLPRVMLIPNAIYMKSREDVLKELKNPQIDLKSTVLIEDDKAGIKNLPAIIPAENFIGNAYITDYESRRVTIKAELSTQGFLILNDLFFPGWKAYVDGIQRPILAANYLFRGVELTSGNHMVIFMYDPYSFKLGCFTFVVSLLVFGVFVIMWRNLKEQ